MPLTQKREWDQEIEVVIGDIFQKEHTISHHGIMLQVDLPTSNLHISILSYPSTIIEWEHAILINIEDIRVIMFSCLSQMSFITMTSSLA